MLINQNVLIQHGVDRTTASNIIMKLVNIGVHMKSAKTIITYERKGKMIESIIWMKSIDIQGAIKALAVYCAKTPYSRRVNVDHWMEVMQLLKSIRDGIR